MPVSLADITAKVTADTSDFDAKMSAVSATFGKVAQSGQQAESGLTQAGSSLTDLGAKAQSAGQSLQTLGTNVQAAATQTAQGFTQAGAGVTQFDANLTKVGQTATQATQGLTTTSQGAQQLGQGLAAAGTASAAFGTNLQQIQTETQSLQQGLTAAGTGAQQFGQNVQQIGQDSSQAATSMQQLSQDAAQVGQAVAHAGQDASGGLEAIGAALAKATSGLEGVNATIHALASSELVAFFVEAAAEASKMNLAESQLDQMIENSGKDVADYGERLKEATEQGEAFGFSGSAVVDTLAQLTQVTHDANVAFEALGTVEDLARAKHLSLATAALLVGRALDGQTAALKRYGIVLTTNATAEQTLDELQQQFAGSAQNYANSAQGVADRVSAAWEGVQEKIGGLEGPVQTVIGLLPNLATGFNFVTEAVAKFSESVESGGAAAVALDLAINPVVAGATAIAAGATIAAAAFAHWSEVNAATSKSLADVNAAVHAVFAGQSDLIQQFAGFSFKASNAWDTFNVGGNGAERVLNNLTGASEQYFTTAEDVNQLNEDFGQTLLKLGPGGATDDYAQSVAKLSDELNKQKITVDDAKSVLQDIEAVYSATGNGAAALQFKLTALDKEYADGAIGTDDYVKEVKELGEQVVGTSITVSKLSDVQIAALESGSTWGKMAAGNAQTLPVLTKATLAAADAFRKEGEDVLASAKQHLGYQDSVDGVAGALTHLVSPGQDLVDVMTAVASESGAATQTFLIQAKGADNLLQSINNANSGLQAMLSIFNQIDAIGSASASAADIATKLIGDPGVYAKVDDLLAAGRITLDQYNAAQQQEIGITQDNARVQQDLDVIRVNSTTQLVQQEAAVRKNIDALADLSQTNPDLANQALYLMDSANAAKVASAESTAYAASIGEIPKDVATDIILNAARADPELAKILANYGLIPKDITTDAHVNFPPADKATLDDLVNATNRQTDVELHIAIAQTGDTSLAQYLTQPGTPQKDIAVNLVGNYSSELPDINSGLTDIGAAGSNGLPISVNVTGNAPAELPKVTQAVASLPKSVDIPVNLDLHGYDDIEAIRAGNTGGAGKPADITVTTTLKADDQASSVITAAAKVRDAFVKTVTATIVVKDEATAALNTAQTDLQTFDQNVQTVMSSVEQHTADSTHNAGISLDAFAVQAAADGQSAGDDFSTNWGVGLQSAENNTNQSMSAITTQLDALDPNATSAGTNAGQHFGEQLSNGLDTAESDTSSFMTDIATAMDGLAAGATTAGTNAGQSFDDGLTGALQTAENDVIAIIADIQAPMDALQTETYAAGESAGSNFGQGLVDGLASQEAAVISEVNALTNDAIVDQTGSNLALHSPSHIAYAMGVDWVQGLINGIQSKVADAISGTNDVTSGVVGATDALSDPAISSGVTTLGSAIADLTTAIQDLDSHLSSLTGTLGGAGQAADDAAAKYIDLNDGQLHVAKGADALNGNLKTSAEIFGDVSNAASDAAPALHSLGDYFGLLFSDGDALNDNLSAVPDSLQLVTYEVGQQIDAFDALLLQADQTGQALGNFQRYIADVLETGNAWDNQLRTLPPDLEQQAEVIGKNVSWLRNLADQQDGSATASDDLNGSLSNTTDTLGAATDAAGDAGTAFGDLGNYLGSVETQGNSLNDWLNTLPVSMQKAAHSAGDDIVAFDALLTQVDSTGQALDAFNQYLADVAESGDSLTASLNNMPPALQKQAKGIGDEIVNLTNVAKQSDAAAQSTNDLTDSLNTSYDALGEAPKVGAAAGAGMADGIGAGTERSNKELNTIPETMDTLPPKAKKAGQATGDSFANAMISSIESGVKGRLAGQLGVDPDSLNSLFGNSSPSGKAARTGGKNVGDSFAAGVSDSAPDVASAADKVAKVAVEHFSRKQVLAAALGKGFGQDYWEGLLSQTPQTEEAAVYITEQAMKAAKTASQRFAAQGEGIQLQISVLNNELSDAADAFQQKLQDAAESTGISVADLQNKYGFTLQKDPEYAEISSEIADLQNQYVTAEHNMTAAAEKETRKRIDQAQQEIRHAKDPQAKQEAKADLDVQQKKLDLYQQLDEAISEQAAATTDAGKEIAQIKIDAINAQLDKLKAFDPASLFDSMGAGAADASKHVKELGKNADDATAHIKHDSKSIDDSATTIDDSMTTHGKHGGDAMAKGVGDGIDTADTTAKKRGPEIGADFASGVGDGIQSGGGKLKDDAAGMINDLVTNNVTRAKQAGQTLGEDFATGFANGMIDPKSTKNVDGAAEEMVQNAEDAARKAAESQSPSQRAARIGEDWSAGFAVGIADNAHAVEAASRKMVQAAAKAAASAATQITPEQLAYELTLPVNERTLPPPGAGGPPGPGGGSNGTTSGDYQAGFLAGAAAPPGSSPGGGHSADYNRGFADGQAAAAAHAGGGAGSGSGSGTSGVPPVTLTGGVTSGSTPLFGEDIGGIHIGYTRTIPGTAADTSGGGAGDGSGSGSGGGTGDDTSLIADAINELAADELTLANAIDGLQAAIEGMGGGGHHHGGGKGGGENVDPGHGGGTGDGGGKGGRTRHEQNVIDRQHAQRDREQEQRQREQDRRQKEHERNQQQHDRKQAQNDHAIAAHLGPTAPHRAGGGVGSGITHGPALGGGIATRPARPGHPSPLGPGTHTVGGHHATQGHQDVVEVGGGTHTVQVTHHEKDPATVNGVPQGSKEESDTYVETSSKAMNSSGNRKKSSDAVKKHVNNASADSKNDAKKAGKKTGDAVGDGAASGVNAATTKVGSAMKTMVASAGAGTADTAYAEGYAAGEAFGEGYAAGLADSQPAVAQQSGQLADTTTDTHKKKHKSHSPSQVARDLGRDWGKGLVLGYEDSEAKVAAAAKQLAAVGAAPGAPTGAPGAPGAAKIENHYHIEGDVHIPSAKEFEALIQRITRAQNVTMGRRS